MTQPIYFEDLQVGAETETGARTITETDIVVHAGHTGDFFPHHMDAEFAKQTSFGQRIAHGTLTFVIAVGLKAALVNPAAFTYGYERLRFPRPVFIGDTIRVRATLKSAEPDPKRPSYGRCTETCEVRNQNDEIVLVYEDIALVERRPEAS